MGSLALGYSVREQPERSFNLLASTLTKNEALLDAVAYISELRQALATVKDE